MAPSRSIPQLLQQMSLANSSLDIQLHISPIMATPLGFAPGFPQPALVMRNAPHTEMPTHLYGIAFKRDNTADLVYTALKMGYRAIDSANWPRTYDEPRAAEGVKRAVAEGIVKRGDIYIQSKFSPSYSADRNWVPYNPDQPIEAQVAESIHMSLTHFAIPGDTAPYLDSVVVHIPYPDPSQTLAAYRALCQFVPHQIRQVGVSNFSLEQLVRIENDCAAEGLPLPAVVQNRLANVATPPGRDAAVRAHCRKNGIIYQPFGLFGGNPDLCGKGSAAARVVSGVEKRGGKVDVVGAMGVLMCAMGGIAALDGSSGEAHMESNLRVWGVVKEWAEREAEEWEGCVRQFRREIGESED